MDTVEEELNLVHKILNGDQQAVQIFYDTYADDLYAFICHLMSNGHNENAEDIWQESLLAGFNGLGSFRGGSRLFTWLCAIARFKILASYRREKTASIEIAEASLEQIGQMMDQTPLPENLIVQRETQARIVEVMQLLPSEYSRILVARYVDGKTIGEISALIMRSYKASESLLARAKVRFLEEFKKSGGKNNA